MKTLEQVFWGKVFRSADDACWPWQGAKRRRGYGELRWKGKILSAHRVVYELLVGPIPEGLTIDHLCFNTSCVNPKHLEPVTREENIRRYRATITHCKRGHELSSGECMFCRRIYARNYMRRKLGIPPHKFRKA